MCVDRSVNLRDLNTLYMPPHKRGSEVCHGNVPDSNATREQNSLSRMWRCVSGFRLLKEFFQDVFVGRDRLHMHTCVAEKASLPLHGVGGCSRELLVLLES